MRRRSCTVSTARTSSPSMAMLPRSASISRLARRSSVVLPEPEPPTMARNCPSATSSETSSTASTGFAPRPPSKCLLTCANAINGGSAVIGWDITLPSGDQAAVEQRCDRLNCPGRGVKPRAERGEIGGCSVRAGAILGSTAVALDDATVAFRLADARLYTAVEQARLSVEDGEFVAIVGPTGCGKSTLLNVAAGLLRPVSGTVRIFDAPLTGLNRQAGYLFQADALFPWKTAIDNVALGLEIAGVGRREALGRARQWLNSVGL